MTEALHGFDERAARLLLKAIRSLPQREQDHVLRALIGRAMSERIERPARPRRLRLSDPEPSMRPGPPFGVAKQMSVPLLVRLPEDLHARLRRWSTENGFSMAAVARGLIERFLDRQEAEPG